MHAEVPQPISTVPSRWAGFTASQLGWLAVGAMLPYLGGRVGLPAPAEAGFAIPWAATAVAMAFGRWQGRGLDAFLADALLFRLQHHRLEHPGSTGGFRAVDRGRGAIPWTGGDSAA